MKLMFPKNSCLGALSIVLFICLALTSASAGQTKKAAAAKKSTPTKSEQKAKNDKKPSSDKDKATAKNKAEDAKKKSADKSKQNAKNNDKGKNAKKDDKDKKSAKNSEKGKGKEKLSAKEQAKADREQKNEARNKKNDRNSKRDPEKLAEAKRAAAERRRQEEERRQAALAEQRRREQAAREARARQIAFERGLRTETVANIEKDNTEGEDLAIRSAAINALGSHAGSVVVMEAQTGKVITIVNQDWAIRDSVKPCSTIKLVTGVAGLNEGVISKDNGSIKNTASRRDLDDALAYSDNPYFQRAGAIVGNGKMIEYARQLGLGEPTGLNVEGETPGRLAIGNNNPRIYSHGDDFEVSTVQLAVMVSAITNGGNRVLPRIPRNSLEKAKFQTFYKSKVDVPQQSVRRVIPGMMGAAEYGTARRGVDASLGIAGKTGSCISKGTWVGLFASVAPIENPKYSVAVITRGQSERGRHAAAVAGKIYRALARNIIRTDRNLAQTEFKLTPRYPANTVTAAKVVEEEDDEAEAESSLTNGVRPRTVPAAVTQVPLVKSDSTKLVTRTGNSKPVFPPVIITYDKDNPEDSTGKGTRPE